MPPSAGPRHYLVTRLERALVLAGDASRALVITLSPVSNAPSCPRTMPRAPFSKVLAALRHGTRRSGCLPPLFHVWYARRWPPVGRF
jgi:hypothetical protein